MSDRRAILLLHVLLTGILALVFGDVFLNPNSYLFGTLADGIKNYFTFAWYVKYDTGLHFSGMNYPFGEHIVYTDNQPLFSIPAGIINRYFLPLEHHIFGLINGIIFACMFASAMVLYFIFRKCNLPPWPSIAAALLTLLLSPQHSYITQQYALCNTLVLPAIWLTIIIFFDKPQKLRGYVWYFLVLLLSGFIHPYFLPMGLLTYLGYWLWYIFKNRNHWQGKALRFAALLLWGFVPLAVFKIILSATDVITDRPEHPLYAFQLKANLAGLFYPTSSFTRWIFENLFFLKLPPEENHGYLGLAGLLGLAALAIIIGYTQIKKSGNKTILQDLSPALAGGIWAGILILIMAMGIITRFMPEPLLDHLTILKQFRVINRFSWMFYYLVAALSIYAIFRVYQVFRKNKRNLLAFSWLAFFTILWSAEAIILLKQQAEYLHKNKTAAAFTGKTANIQELLNKAGHSVSDFQMVLPVPYYSEGSEKLGIRNWGVTMLESMKAAYQTGIPISTAALSRTSLSQVLLRTQLLSSDSIRKELLLQLPNQKSFLIVVTDSAEKDYEKRLVQRANFLTKHKNVSYYELPLAALKTLYKEPKKLAGATLNLDSGKVVFNSFSELPGEKWLFRKGAFFAANGPAVLFINTLPNASTAINYEFSVWVNATVAIGIPVIKLEEINAANQVINQQTLNLQGATEIYKDWLRASMIFKLKSPENQVKITATGKNILADELLIRPVKQPFYYYTEDGKQLIRNNYLLYNQ